MFDFRKLKYWQETHFCDQPASRFDEKAKFAQQRNDEEYKAHDGHSNQIASGQLPLKRRFHSVIQTFHTRARTHHIYRIYRVVQKSKPPPNYQYIVLNPQKSD